MPTYYHECSNSECLHEWEDFYSISTSPPTICPKCSKETAQRVINCKTKGVVELTGQELVDSVKAAGRAVRQEAHKNENLYANLLGNDRYQSIQQRMDKRRR